MTMTRILKLTVVLLISMTCLGQTMPTLDPPPMAGPGFGWMNPPAGLLDQWWNHPGLASELQLTDAQKKQLQEASLAQRLALIDAGADALKAYTRLGALLDARQVDEAAFNQQLGQLSAAAGHIIQDFGTLALTTRRVLTPEQWQKLQSLRPKGNGQRKGTIPQETPPPAGHP